MKSNRMHLRWLALLSLAAILLGGISGVRGQGNRSALYLPVILRNPQAPSANTYVRPYREPFQYGLNPGYYGNGWDDRGVYGLCYDAGCRSARNSLPDSFLAEWGDTIRVATLAYAVDTLDFAEITTFLGSPRSAWRDPNVYDGQQSKLWQGMYTPIWDDGENGTPVNEANRFAVYVWKVVSNYGPFIRFYEIINEPDFTHSSYGWAAPGTAGSWWDGPPQPKDLPNLNAPIYHYIRLLRIAYEVVHRYDSDAYVTPGGIGYDSFLDALLRYSDNPDGGALSDAYPLTGGAYFDALSFHIYPQYGTRHWDGSKWVPDRHSDKAVEVVLNSYEGKLATLASHGYDGVTYPEKVLLITEINVARKQIAETLGGEELQRNFTIKTLVKAQQAGIAQIYWFVTGENKNYDDATADSYDLMGFYENLKRDTPGNQKITPQGVANRTTYQQLYGWAYDPAATQALALPASVDGAAFRQGNAFRYVLWAKTGQDRSEAASATLNLPGSYTAVAWNGTTSIVNGAGLQLSGAPLFLTAQK